MANIVNSFTQTVDNLVQQVNIALQTMVSMNEAMSTKKDSVAVSYELEDPLTGNVSTSIYKIPSYNYVINQLDSMNNTVGNFISGKGYVAYKDGSTYRQITTVPVPAIPTEITGINSPTTFTTRNNWFFESMMFPQLLVNFDLKGKIEDTADEVYVKRIIVDNPTTVDTQWFIDTFVNSTNQFTYADVVSILNANNKRFWEDDEVLDLPLTLSPYSGTFFITNSEIDENGQTIYYLNTLNYALTSDSSLVYNQQLSVGSLLRYANSIYKVSDINTSRNSIKVTLMSGLDYPSINNTFEIYSDPYAQKIVSIPIGYDECNIIFIKGINPYYDLQGSQWGTGIPFWSNNLVLNNNTITLSEYYSKNVADFGRQLEGQAKEKYIPAFFGSIPDAPVITADMFSVKQINTHLNSALSNSDIITTKQQIDNTKSNIDSLKSTISLQKASLVELTDVAARRDLQSQIDANISKLKTATTEYSSLVESLATIAYENSAVLADPKYRIRGFFPIPNGKPSIDSTNSRLEEIIQFDIAYRYLRLDNTGNPLADYSYTDPSTGQKVTGVFSEWNIVQSPIKQKVYDASTSTYVWKSENITDGESVNINQIDIPIQKGEKVEIKIRSISEAGWPINPLKSDWSNSIIIDFPANLQGTDQVQNILSDAATEETTVKLQDTLDAAGVTVHINDSIPNPASANGTYFKHLSSNLEINKNTKDSTGAVISQTSVDLQSFIDDFSNNYYITVIDTSTATTHTTTLQKLLQEILRVSPVNWNNI